MKQLNGRFLAISALLLTSLTACQGYNAARTGIVRAGRGAGGASGAIKDKAVLAMQVNQTCVTSELQKQGSSLPTDSANKNNLTLTSFDADAGQKDKVNTDYLALWDLLLAKNVDKITGLVDYKNLAGPHAKYLDLVVRSMAAEDSSKLTNDQMKLAFWINAYNANMIQRLASKPNDVKVSDDDTFLFRTTFKVAGQDVTLLGTGGDSIALNILRAGAYTKNPSLSISKNDPRIRFSLVSGAKGDPILRNFAYTPENINDALAVNTSLQVNDPVRFKVATDHIEYSIKKDITWDDFKGSTATPGSIFSAYALNCRGKSISQADFTALVAKEDFTSNTHAVYDDTVNRKN